MEKHRNDVRRVYREVWTWRDSLKSAVRSLGRVFSETMFYVLWRNGLIMPLFGTTFANDELKLIYNATAIANIADNAATSPLTNIYWSLHTADPSAGNQSTSEVSYTGYARQAVARTSGGYTVTGASVSPVANVVFPVSTSGTPTVTNFATGSLVSGTGKVIDAGTVTPNIVVSTSVVQTLTTGSTITRT